MLVVPSCLHASSANTLPLSLFAVSALPPCYRTTAVHGFVEELVVDNDPEYGWVWSLTCSRAQ